jgi:hypothetical protein
MTPQQMVGLAVRLFAIWLVLVIVQTIGVGMNINNQPGLEQNNTAYFFAAGFVVLAVLIWLFPMVIAHRLIPRTKYNEVIQAKAHEVVVASCVVIGLALFVGKVLPSLAYYVSLAVSLNMAGTPIAHSRDFHWMQIGPILIQFVVVLVLCFKAHAIAKFFLTERGYREPPTEEDAV